jgi:hypothetical protein
MTAVMDCYISKSVEMGHDSSILNDLRRVPVTNNIVLQKIMECQGIWSESPIIWVDNTPYKLVLVYASRREAVMYQVNMYLGYDGAGRIILRPLRKRKVKITFW